MGLGVGALLGESNAMSTLRSEYFSEGDGDMLLAQPDPISLLDDLASENGDENV